MALSAEMMEKLAAANPSGGGNFVQHGRFTFALDQFIEKADGFKGASFIAELFVLESAPATDGKKSEAPNNPRGSRASVVFNLSGGNGGQKAAQAAQGNLKAFVIGLVGKEGYDRAMADERLGDTPGKRYFALLELLRKSGRGALVGDETYLGKIQSGTNAGKDIVNHKWSYIDTTEEARAGVIAIMDNKAKLPPEGTFTAQGIAGGLQSAASA